MAAMSNQLKRTLFAILCLIWGSTWLAIRLTVAELPPLTGAGLRFVLATVCVLAYALFRKKSLRLAKPGLHGWMMLCALLVYVIDYGLIYWAEQFISAGVTAIFFATFPLFTALFSRLILAEREISRTGLLGIVLGFLGIVIVFFDQLIQTRFQTIIMLASLAVVVAAVSAGLATVLVKKVARGIPALAVTFHQLFWGSIFLALLSLLFTPLPRSLPSMTALGATFYLGTVGTALAFVLYYRLLQEKSAVSISTIGYITPLIALLLDFLVFTAIPPLKTWLGMLIVFLAIYLVNRPGPLPALPLAPEVSREIS